MRGQSRAGEQYHPLNRRATPSHLAAGVFNCRCSQRRHVAARIRLADAQADDFAALQALRRNALLQLRAAEVQHRGQANLEAFHEAPHHAAGAAAADFVDEDELMERVEALRGRACVSARQSTPVGVCYTARRRCVNLGALVNSTSHTSGPGPAYASGHGGPTTPGSKPAAKAFANNSLGMLFCRSQASQKGVTSVSTNARTRSLYAR